MFYVTDFSDVGHTALTSALLHDQSGKRRSRPLTLESVWETLREDEWESETELKIAAGLDDDALAQVIKFLDHWRFVETKRTPELFVRRKSGVISPIETFQILSSITPETPVPSEHNIIAERVACCNCGGLQFTSVGNNELECVTCHEKQWRTLQGRGQLDSEPATAVSNATPTILKRALIRLGHPQKAFTAYIPKATQYFWFRCTHCGETAADYPHGHSKRFTCPICRSSNEFW